MAVKYDELNARTPNERTHLLNGAKLGHGAVQHIQMVEEVHG